VRIRPARASDVGPLLAIEAESFTTDKLTTRKLRRLMTRGNCALLVATVAGDVAGYALVLFRAGSRSARLYGIAVRRSRRGGGFGRRLLRAAEAQARRRGCDRMRLEVAGANRVASALYEEEGYDLVAHLGPYYEDGAPADRYAKDLRRRRG
jgi:[ribosomal protein S18]-alanine N-acetyltransferase